MSCLSTKEVNTRMSAAPATPHASRSAAQCRPPASTPRDIQVCSRRTMFWKRGPVQVTTPPQLKTQQNTRKYTRFLRLSQNIAPVQVTTPSQLKNQEKCWKTRQNQPLSKNVALCRSQLRHNLVTTSFTLGSRLAMHTGKKKENWKYLFFQPAHCHIMPPNVNEVVTRLCRSCDLHRATFFETGWFCRVFQHFSWFLSWDGVVTCAGAMFWESRKNLVYFLVFCRVVSCDRVVTCTGPRFQNSLYTFTAFRKHVSQADPHLPRA